MAVQMQVPGPPQPMPVTAGPSFLPPPGAPGPVPGMPGLPSTAPQVPGAALPGTPAAPAMNNAPNPMLLMALLQHAAMMKKKTPGPDVKAPASKPASASDALDRAAGGPAPKVPMG